MKKHFLLMLGALIALPTLAADGDNFTYTYEGQTLTYTVINEAAKTVRTANGWRRQPGNEVYGDLILPAEVYNESTQYTLAEIGEYAFYECINLKSVSIPESVQVIGNYAFGGSFNGCGLTSVTIPNSVSSVGKGAFRCCNSLLSVTLPESITSISRYTFENCSSLISVVIPNSVTEISDRAFSGCGLTSVSISENISKLGVGPFSGCTSLKSISVAPGNNNYILVDGAVYTKDMSLLVQYPAGKVETEITISNSVTKIGDYSLYGCSALTRVVIPNSVTTIGKYAFWMCSGLTSVIIPNSVTTIDENAFWMCNGLASIDIPNSVTEIGQGAFTSCTGLTSVTIPNSITKIGEWVFSHCSGLTSVSIPNSVTEIGEGAFSDCTSLTSVTIPNSITSISSYTFENCSSLILVIIPNSVTTIGYDAFWGCSDLTSITIPKSVTTIYAEAFGYCDGLTSVTYLAEEPIDSSNDIFDEETYENATLNYLKSAEEKIAATEPWSLFVNRIGRDAGPESAIMEVEATDSDATAVYNMRGIKVSTSTDGLPKGIYIIREGDSTRKIAR